MRISLEEATLLALKGKLQESNEINEEQICKELQKVKNIIKVEYDPKFEDHSCKGEYILYLSKYLKKLANQWSVGLTGRVERNNTQKAIEEILNKYNINYDFDMRDDYLGYWYIQIRK